jgi:hypothetical protein
MIAWVLLLRTVLWPVVLIVLVVLLVKACS